MHRHHTRCIFVIWCSFPPCGQSRSKLFLPRGKVCARCGGLADAVQEGLKEQGLDFTLKAVSCDGIEACRMALLKKSKNVLDANFVEGMACVGGCIGGAGCLTHGEKNKAEVDKYGHEAHEKTIEDAISVLNL